MLNRFRAFALCLFVCMTGAHAATLLPPGKAQFLDANGNPLAGGSITFYIPGTSTLKDTYQDAGSSVLNTNPVTLDSAGQAVIYGTGAYREVVRDSLGNTIYDQLTADTSSSNTSWGGHSGGSANAQTVSAPNFTSSDGQIVSFIATYTNTTALTVNPSGAGGLNVLKDLSTGSASLSGGEVVAGNLVNLVYDATLGAFHLASLPPPNNAEPFTSVASAGTTNLGAAATRNVTITGTAGITSFGSSAATNFPVYRIRFSGALTLTYNATSMILPGSADITTAANDSANAVYLGAGNWQVISYQRANGKAVVETQQLPTQTGNAGKLLTTDGTAPSWTTVIFSRGTITGGTSTISNAVNATVTRTSAGAYTVVFGTAASSTNYQVAISHLNGGYYFVNVSAKRTNGFDFITLQSAAGPSADSTSYDFIVVGG